MKKTIKIQTIITMMKSSIGYIIRGYMDNLDTNFSNEEQLKMIYILCRRERMYDARNFTSVSDKLKEFHYTYRYKGYSDYVNKRFLVFLIYLERAGFWNPKIDNNPNYYPSCGSQTEDEYWQDHYKNSKHRSEKRERLNKAARLITRNYVNHENEKRDLERRIIERKETERKELERRILEREKSRK